MKRPLPIVAAALAAAVLFASVPAAARADDATRESAVWQLKTATFVHNNRMHNVLLRSLRQLRDPALEPLFSELVSKKHPELQIHGILGLAEIDPKQQINLALVADVKDTREQAQIVTLAIESELITADQLKQMLAWPELELAVKIIIAARLVELGEPVDPAVLDAGTANDDVLWVKGLAGMLKLQTGDPSGMKALDEVSASDRPERDTMREVLLQRALRHKLDKSGPWAMKILAENAADSDRAYLALRVAIGFQQPGAAERLLESYRTSDSVADRIRHVVLALEVADKLDPKVFEVMAGDDVSIVQYMARTGKVVAEGGDPTTLMMKLVEQNHLLASKWVLKHAEEMPIDQAKTIYVGIILAAEGEPNDPRFRGQRIENAVLATQALAERMTDPGPVLRKLIQQVPPHTSEAMLMGLIRTEDKNAAKFIEGLDTWDKEAKAAPALALLLRARHADKFTPEQLKELALVVRGGAAIQAPLRIQAAWLYAKLTGQHQVYLAEVLGK